MSLSYEKSKIVEFYDPTMFQVEPNESTIIIHIKYFKRYVYRPIVGHDILISQFFNRTGQETIQMVRDKYYGDSQEELCQHIAYDLLDFDCIINWEPFATKMSKYVRDMGYEGQHFFLEADEGKGKLYVMHESRGWRNSFWRNDNNQQRTTDDCTICLDNLPDEEAARLGLPCCHVFHKNCLAQWILTNGSNCPTCRDEL